MFSRFVLTEEAVVTDAENLGIDASIIAGRIRKERNDFTLLTRLVGQDAVRRQLETGMAPKNAFYVPCLRWRQAEYQALLALSDKAKDSLVPLITISDLEFDFEDGTQRKPLMSMSARFQSASKTSGRRARPGSIQT